MDNEKELEIKDILCYFNLDMRIRILEPTPDKDNKWTSSAPTAKIMFDGKVKDAPYALLNEELGDIFPSIEDDEPVINLVYCVWAVNDEYLADSNN